MKFVESLKGFIFSHGFQYLRSWENTARKDKRQYRNEVNDPKDKNYS